MKRLLFIVEIIFMILAVEGGVVAPVGVAAQPPPPPTPTLVPVVGPDPSATQTLQLQEFTRDLAYLIRHTTIYTTTSSGASWALERRVSYGEAAVVVLLIAVALIQVGDLVNRFTTRGRR